MLFVEKENTNTLINIFRQHSLKFDGDDKGTKKHRFKVVHIDKTKGSATGYIAKYISKNIDGHNIDKDLHGNETKSSAVRIEAWASLWGIRQFDFFGNPPVTIWRELRRIKNTDNPELILAVQAADEGDWAKFIKLMGGPCTDKKFYPIAIMRVWSDESNMYGEPIGYRIIGVEFDSGCEISRIHEWVIGFKSFEGEGTSPPWSSVNNCTEHALQ